MKEIESLIARARKYLESAEILLKSRDYESSVSRVYYAMFYSVEALLAIWKRKRCYKRALREPKIQKTSTCAYSSLKCFTFQAAARRLYALYNLYDNKYPEKEYYYVNTEQSGIDYDLKNYPRSNKIRRLPDSPSLGLRHGN